MVKKYLIPGGLVDDIDNLVEVVVFSEHNKIIKEINDYHDQRWKIRDQYMKDEMIKKSDLNELLDEFEKELLNWKESLNSKTLSYLFKDDWEQLKKQLGIK